MLLSFVCEKTRSIIWWSKCTSVSASRPLRRESAPAAHSHFYRPHVWEHMSEHADAEIVSTCFLHVPIRNVLVRCLLCLWVGLHGGGRKGGGGYLRTVVSGGTNSAWPHRAVSGCSACLIGLDVPRQLWFGPSYWFHLVSWPQWCSNATKKPSLRLWTSNKWTLVWGSFCCHLITTLPRFTPAILRLQAPYSNC